MPIEPTTVPKCLHPSPSDPSGKYQLRNSISGIVKPVLWVIDGCGLHEMEFCDPRRDELPQHAFARFPEALLRSGTVVYQPVGAGFLMKAARRFKGECASINADQIAAKERAWLDSRGVRYYDYTRLSLQYAPLMFDAIHFTYYWVPCTHTFPELARLVAQLGFQQAVGRPVEVCPPGTPPAPVSEGAEATADGMSVARLHLGQDQESVQRAYTAAMSLASRASKGAKQKSGGIQASATSSAPETMESAIERIVYKYGGKKNGGALRLALQNFATQYSKRERSSS